MNYLSELTSTLQFEHFKTTSIAGHYF